MAKNTSPAIYLWPNGLLLLLAIWLFISPWVIVGATMGAAAWNTWVVAVVIGALSIGALAQFAEWEDWLNLVLGAWLFFSPWIFSYTTMTNMAWNSYIVGVVVALIAIWGIAAARTSKEAFPQSH